MNENKEEIFFFALRDNCGLIVLLGFQCPVYSLRVLKSRLKTLNLFLVSDVSSFYEFH
jgi:hypothetical protein